MMVMVKFGLCLLFASLVVALDVELPGSNEEDKPNRDTLEDKLKTLLDSSNKNAVIRRSTLSGSDACVTPDDEEGACVHLTNCPSYLELFRQNQDKNTIAFLRSRICKILPRGFHFCCPVTTRNVSVSIPSEKECGLPSGNRIKGGTEAEIGKWPWQAAIGQPLPDSGFQIVCGGSLITIRHVLTAAHCSVESDVPENLRTHVRVGDHHLKNSSDRLSPQDIRIASRRTNGYNSYTKANDIELLILERDVIFNDYVKPVCLPIASSLRNDNFEGRNGTITGWGRFSFDENAPRSSNVILEADVPIVALDSCRDIYQSKTVGTVVDNTNICAGIGDADACKGDSGGPLNYLNPDNKRYYVIGIVSHGVGCGNPDFPGVYSRVGAFIDWIVNNIE